MVGGGMTVNSSSDAARCPFTATVIFPVSAPLGKVTVSAVAVAAVTVAEISSWKVTMFSLDGVLKFVPVTVTVVPTIPLWGEKEVMVGGTGVPSSSFLHEVRFNTKVKINTKYLK